jgi:hypothetical protein
MPRLVVYELEQPAVRKTVAEAGRQQLLTNGYRCAPAVSAETEEADATYWHVIAQAADLCAVARSNVLTRATGTRPPFAMVSCRSLGLAVQAEWTARALTRAPYGMPIFLAD